MNGSFKTHRYLEDDSTSLLSTIDSDHATLKHTQTKVSFPQHLLQLGCFALHVGLVAVHLMLLFCGFKHWEHNITSAVDQQTTLSFLTTTISEATGIIYGSILVFLTQKLAIHRNIRSFQTLTKSHDSISSWAGFGSALATLRNQLSVSASIFGTLKIAGYLGCVSILHISIPAVFSVETFNSSVSVDLDTWGYPGFNATNISESVGFYVGQNSFLPWINNLDESQTLGLFNNSLYEVLQDTNLGSGEAPVSAIGFNISCGYLPYNVTQALGMTGAFFEASEYQTISLVHSNTLDLSSLGFHVPTLNESIIIYTTVKIVDSEGLQPPSMVNEARNTINLNIIQCAKSLVNQSGIVDTQSRKLNPSSLYPNIHKVYSQWDILSSVNSTPGDSTLIGGNSWVQFMISNYRISDSMTNVEEYLMEYLELDPISTNKPVLNLHDIENAVSALVATSFWIGGHIMSDTTENPTQVTPILATGKTSTQQQMLRARLNANQTAIIIGLAVSLILTFIYTLFLPIPSAIKGSVQTVGLLQIIWLCQQHPNHPNLVDNVVEPTDNNLRQAGLVKVKLYNHTSATEHPIEDKLEVPTAQSDPTKGHSLKAISMTLHIFLVLIHLTLLGMLLSGRGSGFVFPFQLQNIVSFRIKLVANTIGIVYYAVLVYLTQRLAIGCTMQKYLTLTSIHDQSSAWSGVGSSLSVLANQFGLPASALTTLSIFTYLSAISVLHATTPALVSAEIFNLTTSSTVTVKGIPEWNSSNYIDTLSYLEFLTPGFLSWIRNLDQPKTLGLFNESLYDVLLDSYPGGATASVNAIGFNITCGHLAGINTALTTTAGGQTSPNETGQGFYTDGIGQGFYNISFSSVDGWFVVPAPGPDIVTFYAMTNSSPSAYPDQPGSVILYTTSTILDSEGQTGSPIALTEGTVNPNIPGLQFLQCARTLVSQTAIIEAGSRTVIPSTMNPPLYKNTSKWEEYTTSVSNNTNTTLLGGDFWVELLNHPPPLAGIGPVLDGSFGGKFTTSGIDEHLMQQLGLNPPSIFNETSGSGQTVYLHDIENALSNLVATLFWIAGNIQPSSLTMKYGFVENLAPGYNAPGYMVANVQSPPKLSEGETKLEQFVPAIRLSLDLFAVSLGLGASLLGLILAAALSVGKTSKHSLNGIGLLHTMWLYQHHPELSEILEKVDDPTDHNLRAAGLVKICLLDALDVPSQ